MSWLDRLERRFGQWSIPQFPLFIVMANASIFFLSMVRPDFVNRLTLDPSAVFQGEWWRVITFLFIPPPMNLLWMAFWLYLIFYFAQALESAWGEFRFCFFYLLGAFATVIAAMFIVKDTLTNVPLNTTLFLAFATLYPDFEIFLFFIIRMKVKVLAWVYWALALWSFVMGTFVTRVAIAASLLNYVLFFGPGLWQSAKLRWEVLQNRRRFRKPPQE